MKLTPAEGRAFAELLAAMDEIAATVYDPTTDGEQLAACRAENRKIIEELRRVHQRHSRTLRPAQKLAA